MIINNGFYLDVEELDQCIIEQSNSRSLSEDKFAAKIVMPVYPKLNFKKVRPHQDPVGDVSKPTVV